MGCKTLTQSINGAVSITFCWWLSSLRILLFSQVSLSLSILQLFWAKNTAVTYWYASFTVYIRSICVKVVSLDCELRWICGNCMSCLLQSTAKDKELMHPLYDRYRQIKQILSRYPSVCFSYYVHFCFLWVMYVIHICMTDESCLDSLGLPRSVCRSDVHQLQEVGPNWDSL